MLHLKRLVTAMLGACLIAAFAGPVSADSPNLLTGVMPSTADPALRTGATSNAAAASCWEVKQLHPASASGAYWLLTPRMRAPQRFWCDMSTDGGGWVRIAAAREQWNTAYDGAGVAANLLVAQPVVTRGTQLPSTTVDALLDGRRVDQLTDRVRVRRAMNAAGTTWQEVRFGFASRDRWVWTMGAEHRVATFSFAGVSGSGGQTNSYGVDQSFNRINSAIQSNQAHKWGFAYGTQVTGTNASDSYLWSSSSGQGSALPYAEVYVRPRLMSTDLTFPVVADSGTKAIENPRVPNSAALVNTWGVTGTAGSTSVEGNVEVQAFEQIGAVMYVGGNFRYVQRDNVGTGRVERPFLAAFDATTGEYLPGFAPKLNEQVRALKALPGGALAVGGDFTSANGLPVQGLVVVNPSTGATVSTWGVRIENNVSPGVPRVRALDVAGSHLYLGGSFTHLSRADGTGRVFARNAARVNVSTGQPDAWNPDFNGAVLDLAASEDGARTYFAGHFTTAQGQAANRAAAVMNTGGRLDPVVWAPTWSNSSNNYQRTIEQAGNRVWVGGAEHSLFDFSRSNYQRLGGSITKRGGDLQVIETKGDQLFAGCHCNNWVYQDAYTWSNVGTNWTQADAIGWFGQWNATTGRYVPHFTPEFTARLGSGIWAIKIAADGTVWAGGDIVNGRTTSGSRWLGGFARWAPRDSTAPSPPTNLRLTGQTSSTVSLAWDAATGGVSGYQIIRDDRVIATTNGGRTITVPKGGQNRFFVRAADPAGNVSASTPVLRVYA